MSLDFQMGFTNGVYSNHAQILWCAITPLNLYSIRLSYPSILETVEVITLGKFVTVMPTFFVRASVLL